MNNPLVSVILPVYNCEMYVRQSVESILNQSYANFELLIIDDASTDETVTIIKSYCDDRIQLVEKPNNSGYINSLNYGLKIAKGKYIARMDGDDVSLPERFAKQIAFLETNEDVILCGSWFRILGSDNIVKLPECHNAIKLHFLRGNCIAHPSVMIKKKSLDELEFVYDESREPAEDYDLWVRLALKAKLHNLQEVLLDYRIHKNQISTKRSVQRRQNVIEIKQGLFSVLDLDLLTEERMVLDKLIDNGNEICFEDIDSFKKLRIKLFASNTKTIFEPNGFKKEILHLDKIIVKRCFLDKKKFYPITFLQYLRIKNSLNYKLNCIDQCKLAIKSLVFFKVKQ